MSQTLEMILVKFHGRSTCSVFFFFIMEIVMFLCRFSGNLNNVVVVFLLNTIKNINTTKKISYPTKNNYYDMKSKIKQQLI